VLKKVFQTPNDSYHYFNGYYDKSPLNFDSSKLLVQRVQFCNHLPDGSETLEIGYIDWKVSDKFIKLTETKAWNWQQGCMLQWYDNSHIIYNDIDNNKFVSILFNINTKEKTILDMAIYTLNREKDFALCIDNERHYWFRGGYSYRGVVNENKNKSFDKDDGIWYLDIKENSVKQILTLENLVNFKQLSTMKNTIHYVEHLMINPSGDRFCFLHRWKLDDGGIYSRLYTCNIDGTDLYLLHDNGKMSHFNWKNDNEIIAYGIVANSINKIRKYKNLVKLFIKPLLPLYHKLVKDGTSISKAIAGNSYMILKDRTQEVVKINHTISTDDGHPSWIDGTNSFVSDTYPTKLNSHKAKLFIFDMETQKEILIDQLESIKEFDNSAMRCDLHPKPSFDKKYICIDTMHNQKRDIFIYEI
jgi:hypothetical protein